MKIGSTVFLAKGLAEAAPGDHYPNLRVETLDEEIAWARDFGFAALQVGWRGEAPVEPAQVREVFEGAGVEIAAASGYTDFLHDQHNWPCRDISAVKKMISAAQAMGTGTVVTWGGFGDSEDPFARDKVRAALAELAACAEDHQVRIALELYDQCVVGTVDAINRMADELGSTALGIMMDPPNTMKESDLADLPAYYNRLMTESTGRLFGAHAKGVSFENGVRKLPGPGEGAQDYPAYLRALSGAGYDDYLLIEHVNRETVGPALEFVTRQVTETLGG